MFGNPQRYKVALQQYETRHANAGCLLAVLFVVPFLARNCSFATVCCCILVYVGLVVPLATGYISTGSLLGLVKRIMVFTFLGQSSLLKSAICQSIAFFQWTHSVFLHLEHVHATTNQVMFNMAAEKIICPEEKFVSLYVLLFYTVLACLQQSLKKRQWSQVMHETTAADFVRLTTAFVVARMGKVVVMGLVLLTFSVQFNDIEPPPTYVLLTVTFFFLTQFPGEPGQDSMVVRAVRGLNLHELEGLEEWWVPTICRAAAIGISSVLTLLLALRSQYLMAMLLAYTNVVVPWSPLMECCWRPLRSQRETTAPYPLPHRRQLTDTVCAVCLDDMRPTSARVTPCHHVLHTQCLRKCIQTFHQCPLCKHPL